MSIIGLIRSVRVFLLTSAAIGLAASPAQTQFASDQDSPRAQQPVLQASDWVLGALFFGTLASINIEGLDDFDEVFGANVDGRNAFARRLPRTLGRTEVGLGLAGATYLIGSAVGSSGAARIGVRSMESLVASQILTNFFKITLGRARPDSGLDDPDFRAFSFNTDRWSFPSGHTSSAFALAATVSSELRDSAPWVAFVAYPFATYIGISRVLDERHWLTDTVAGAAVGIFSARLIGRAHGRSRGLRQDGPPPVRLLFRGGDTPILGVSLAVR